MKVGQKCNKMSKSGVRVKVKSGTRLGWEVTKKGWEVAVTKLSYSHYCYLITKKNTYNSPDKSSMKISIKR